MSGTTPYQSQANVEPIAAVTFDSVANMAGFSTVSGCAASYSGANMQKTIAAGSILHTSVVTSVAGNTVTLVSDPTNPRWTYTYINSSGVAAIVSGSAAATPAVPDPGANPTNGLDYVQAALTVATNATYKLDKRVMFPSAGYYSQVVKVKSATQVFTTNTTYADVAASTGTFSFAIGANERWTVDVYIPLTFGGTGGAKFQFTGPAAPTSVAVNGEYGNAAAGDPGYVTQIAVVTAFSSDINSKASSTASASTYLNAGPSSFIHLKAVINNGANAGTVTLQAAQNNSSTTSTLGIGSVMVAQKVG